jgi:hypothetical protein
MARSGSFVIPGKEDGPDPQMLLSIRKRKQTEEALERTCVLFTVSPSFCMHDEESGSS